MSDGEMRDATPERPRVVNAVAIAVSLIVAAFGAAGILGLDHTDREIRDSLVDTWQADALASYLVLPTVFGIGGISLVLARSSSGMDRRRLVVTSSIAFAAFILEFVGMLVLTKRAEVLHGADLSGLFVAF